MMKLTVNIIRNINITHVRVQNHKVAVSTLAALTFLPLFKATLISGSLKKFHLRSRTQTLKFKVNVKLFLHQPRTDFSCPACTSSGQTRGNVKRNLEEIFARSPRKQNARRSIWLTWFAILRFVAADPVGSRNP